MRSVSTLASLHRLPPWHCWPWWCWMLRVPWASRASGAKLVLKLERQWFAKKDKFGSLMYMYLDYIVCGCLLWFWTTLVGSCSYGFGLRLEPWLQDAQRQPGCWLISIQFSGEPQLWRKILGGEVNLLPDAGFLLHESQGFINSWQFTNSSKHMRIAYEAVCMRPYLGTAWSIFHRLCQTAVGRRLVRGSWWLLWTTLPGDPTLSALSAFRSIGKLGGMLGGSLWCLNSLGQNAEHLLVEVWSSYLFRFILPLVWPMG